VIISASDFVDFWFNADARHRDFRAACGEFLQGPVRCDLSRFAFYCMHRLFYWQGRQKLTNVLPHTVPYKAKLRRGMSMALVQCRDVAWSDLECRSYTSTVCCVTHRLTSSFTRSVARYSHIGRLNQLVPKHRMPKQSPAWT
jgi:hypothetical protein